MIDKTLDKINGFVPQKWQWILSHEGFRKYFKNTGWMFVGQMFSLLVSFFVGAWLARYLGPENYGSFNYALAYAGLFSFIASLGIDGILSRDLVARPEKRDELLGTGILLKAIGGALAIILICFSFLFIKQNALIKILIILYSFTFITQAFNVLSVFFQSRVKARQNVTAQLIALFITTTLKVLLIIFNKGIIFLTIIYLLDSIWISIGLFYAYKKSELKISQWKFNFYLAKEMLSGSWLLILSSAASFILTRIDQIMIGNLLDKTSVGIYSVAIRLAEIWYFIPGLILASLFPAIVNSKQKNYLVYRKRLNLLYFLMILIALFIAIPISLFAPKIINIIFGSEYLKSATILRFYIWSSMGFFISWVYYYYLLSENRLYKIFYFYSTLVFLNIFLNYFFIKNIGIIGASLSTLVSCGIAPFLFVLFDLYSSKKYVKNS